MYLSTEHWARIRTLCWRWSLMYGDRCQAAAQQKKRCVQNFRFVFFSLRITKITWPFHTSEFSRFDWITTSKIAKNHEHSFYSMLWKDRISFLYLDETKGRRNSFFSFCFFIRCWVVWHNDDGKRDSKNMQAIATYLDYADCRHNPYSNHLMAIQTNKHYVKKTDHLGSISTR